MKMKTVIIDVDLDISVDAIIADEIKSLTAESATELDNAIEITKLTQKIKADRDRAVQDASDKIVAAIKTTYDAMVAAGDNGLPASSFMKDIEDAIPNISAFTIRMKKFLSDNGSEYFLDKKKVHGTPHYILVPFNKT